MTNQTIDLYHLYKLLYKIAHKRKNHICKHSFMLDIMDMIEQQDYEISTELVKSMVDADDEKTIKLLKEYIYE